MKEGTIIIWNGKPHTFIGFRINTLYLYNGRQQFEALVEEVVDEWWCERPKTFYVAVKDAFNKMEVQQLTTI